MHIKPEFDHRIDTLATRNPMGPVDELNRQSVARLLVDKLLRERETVVGVYGTWGSGKSFVLDLTIEELFRTRIGIRPIVCYFQPWSFEPDTSLAPGMILSLQAVDSQFPDRNPALSLSDIEQVRRLGENLWRLMRRAVSWLKPAAQGVAAGLSRLPAGTFTGQEITAATFGLLSAALPGTDREEPPSAWNPAQIRSEMANLIRAIREAAARQNGGNDDDYRVVVVIDDLDRCTPDLMVDMLNWLKVHLSVEGCAFLLALDHEAAARAIVGRYREYLGETADVAYGLRYLEKIVDFEVELGRSDLVERMAAKALDQNAVRVEQFVERALDRQGVRSGEINRLMRLPTLQSPRTMLKVVDRFRDVLESVRQQQEERLRGDLSGVQFPVDYPFWLLVLVAMYYRLAPGYIEAFCYGRRPLAGALASRGLDQISQPVREFDEFLDSVLPHDSIESSSAPSASILLELYSAVRQLSIR
jgi:KAP family P-loop domain